MDNKNIILSERLRQIAEYVENGSVIADIGTDHAHIPIYLVLKGVIKEAIAMDINSGPLEKARENIMQYECADKIELRLSNGFDALKENQADTAIIAGMGGRLIIDILTRGQKVASSINNFILSPHTDIPLVRKYLQENGYTITNENMVYDEEKYYTIINAVHGKMGVYTEEQLIYGKYLLESRNPVLKDYLCYELNKYNTIIKKLNGDSVDIVNRRSEVNDKIRIAEKALKYWEGWD